MSLAQALAAIRALHDLPLVISELGLEPLWQELPPLEGAEPAATVGRTGGFGWLGVESDTAPAPLAARIARRLSQKGQIAGIAALDLRGRELALGVSFGSGEVLNIGLDAPDPVALASLARLRPAGERSAIAYAARAADALAGRGVDAEFFRQFRATLQELECALGARPPNAADRRALALLQLTRVLFLYFVQSKGWLDGRPDFLARAVDSCLARHRGLHRHLLQPLFFGTLNRPSAERSAAVHAFGHIPFLNGGLFEPHPLERHYRVSIPDPVWRSAFDRLFERFHFTVQEGSAAPAIAPDMLGRTFEGVMEPAGRKSSGTYYTPAALVREVVTAAFAALAGARLGLSDDRAAQMLEERDPTLLASLTSAAVLDPACGSGAFLLGALEQLASAHCAPGGSVALARRRALRRNLFGVDLDAMAVRLTELRLWLAVVADDTTDDPRHVRPLPNLDCLVRQGDSLFDPPGMPASGDPRTARRVGALRARLITASGAEKALLARELRSLERAAASQACAAAERMLDHEARELLEAARAPTLFHDRARLAAPGRARLREIRAALGRSRAARRRLEREGEVPWFHFASHFADVMGRGGFDAVIGNPPWVRAEELAPELRERLAERFRWWHGCHAGGFAHRPDLSLAFLERAHELAAPGGIVALLVPAKLAAAGYAAATREALSARTTLHAAADLTAAHRSAFDATVYPMAIVSSKRAPPAGHRVRGELDPRKPATVLQASLGAAPWVMSSDVARIIARVRAAHPALGRRHRCRLGVKTGADAVFLDPPDTEPELLRWAVRGRDVAPWRVEPKRRLLWAHDESGAPLTRLPALTARYLAAHDATLRRRADYSGGPVWTLFRTSGATAPHRVVWPDLARTLSAAVLSGRRAQGCIALNSCYVVSTHTAEQAHALAAWLNSTWIRAMAHATAAPAAGGCCRLSAATVEALPLPDLADNAALGELGRAAAGGKAVEAEVNARVADLLAISRADRAVLAAFARDTADRR